MPTLLLSPRQTDSSQILWREAIKQGWNVERIHSFHTITEEYYEPIPYGEPIFNQVVSERFNLMLPSPPEDFLSNLPYDLRKRKVELTTAGEARKLSGPIFIKPPNNKLFAAKVFQNGKDLPEMPDEDPVLAQEVVEWESEYRMFFLNGKCMAVSNYMFQGNYTKETNYQDDDGERNDLVEWAHSFSFKMPSAVVIDVGIIKSRGQAIIEANEVCGSGIYGCNPQAVLDTLYFGVHNKVTTRFF